MVLGHSSGPLASTLGLGLVSTPTVTSPEVLHHPCAALPPSCLHLCKQSLYELLKPLQFKYVMYFLLGPLIHIKKKRISENKLRERREKGRRISGGEDN